MLIRKIKPDKTLKEFIKYCKEEYRENLVAVVIYGSYAFGYFDKEKSDYDVFVIFKNKIPRGEKEIGKRFPKVFLQYFCTTEDLVKKVNQGHWSIYVTLLKSAKVLYSTKEYKKFLRKMKKMDFLEQLIDTAAMQYKVKKEINALKKSKGYGAAKWALPSIRKRLQFLTYIRKKKLIWNLKRVAKLNKDVLTKGERKFIVNLDKRVRKREKIFTKKDEEICINILNKLNYEILVKELSSVI